ncbi:hypothetical protein [Desulfitibacter alkalitolerans]|nr:hypothetical protein [Desulfitibacter alkalitolerans]
MLFKSKSRMRKFNWLAILAYPIAFIKGLIVGKLLGRLKLGRR